MFNNKDVDTGVTAAIEEIAQAEGTKKKKRLRKKLTDIYTELVNINFSVSRQ